MAKLRIIIADDERPAREFLKAVLREFEDAELVGEAENGGEAVELIKRLKPDLALLDLRMPEIGGLEAVRLLRKSQMPLVAFVTAYDEYAVQAFEVNAVDYLLKPVEKSRLRETLNRAHERLEQDDWRGAEAENIKNAAEIYSSAARGNFSYSGRGNRFHRRGRRAASHHDRQKPEIHNQLSSQRFGDAARARQIHPAFARRGCQSGNDFARFTDARRNVSNRA